MADVDWTLPDNHAVKHAAEAALDTTTHLTRSLDAAAAAIELLRRQLGALEARIDATDKATDDQRDALIALNAAAPERRAHHVGTPPALELD